MITDVPGVLVGHWTDLTGATGCSVVLPPPGTVGACFVAGAAPATRETDLLRADSTVNEVHAIVIGGGSAFGLGAADGVMQLLEERGCGLPVGPTVVPIVPAACLFDLSIGDAHARPGPQAGRTAAEAAETAVAEGSVGAGTGATVGKWAGFETATKGGLGTDSGVQGELVVGALAAVNAVGDVLDESGGVLAGARAPAGAPWIAWLREATSLVVVATNARLDKGRATHVARMSAAGLARTIRPAHTMFDGDIVFCLATGAVEADPTIVGALGAETVASAVRRGVRAAGGLCGVPGLADA